MLCSAMLGKASPTCGRVRVSQRAFSVAAQSLSQQLSAPVSKPNYSAPSPGPRALATSSTERVYVNFHIYKTRAAMAVRLLPPSFTTENGYKTLERDGVMLLEFANANPGQPSGTAPAAGGINRTYNWSNKISFALSPSELGTMLAGDAIASDKGLVMYHDPTKLGKVGEPMKRLTMKQMPDGAISFSLSAAPDNISLPVSRGEFEVLKSLAHYAIPRLLGFDAAFQ